MQEKTIIDNNDSSSTKYVHLHEGVTFYKSAHECFLVRPAPQVYYTVTDQVADFLDHCYGIATVGDLLIRYIYTEEAVTDKQALENTLMIARFIKEGVLILTERPIVKQPRVIDKSRSFIPSNVQLELTKACNLQCYYCYRKAGKAEAINPVPTEQLLDKIHALADYGIASIEITGGEPLLHPDFVQIMELCHEKFVLTGLLTNGTLIDKTLLEKLIPFRDKMVVGVSLDCHIPRIHDQRRGMAGAFEKTLNAIKLLAENGFLTRVSMALDKDNWEYIEPTLLLARESGATAFGYSPILPFGRGGKSFGFWNSFEKDFLKTHRYLTAKYKGFLNIHSTGDTLLLDKPGSCGAGHRVFAIDPQGAVRPCVTFEENTVTFGNLYEDSLEQLFSGTLSKKFAAISAPAVSTCNGCKYEFFCRYCILRGLTASRWLQPGECNWLMQSESQETGTNRQRSARYSAT